jgi:hypothetical protein
MASSLQRSGRRHPLSRLTVLLAVVALLGVLGVPCLSLAAGMARWGAPGKNVSITLRRAAFAAAGSAGLLLLGGCVEGVRPPHSVRSPAAMRVQPRRDAARPIVHLDEGWSTPGVTEGD